MNRRRFPLATLPALALLAALPLRAATYHVSELGSDTHDGTTPAKAFRTIARGIEPLGPGDTLVVGPGVYAEEVFIEKSGTRENPITVKAEIPGRTELVGSVRLTDWAPVKGHPQVFRSPLARATHLVYEKDTDTEYREVAGVQEVADETAAFFFDPEAKALYVHPSDDLGMQHHVVDACVLDYGLASLTVPPGAKHAPRRVGLVLEGFVARDYNTCGLFLQNADDCEIRDCVVHHCRRGIFTHNSLRSRIAGCEVFACADRNNREQGNIGMMGYIFDCVLESNVVHDTRQHGIRFYGGNYGNLMRGNLAYACDIGIHVKGAIYTNFAGVTHLARFSDDGRPALLPGRTNRFEHNVCHQVRGSAGLIPSACLYRFNTGEKSIGGRAAGSNLALATTELAAAGFADEAWHDLRLQSDSPHRGKGWKGRDPGAHPYRDEVFFVGPDGSDSQVGTCIAKAWRTLAHAASVLRPGQTLYVLPGVYAETLVLRGLDAGGGATFVRAHGRQAAVLDGGGTRGAGAEIDHCRNVRVQGLRVRNTTASGVRITNSADVHVEECEIFDNAGDGVAVLGASTEARVLRNTLVGNCGAGAVAAGTAAGTWVVGNILRDNAAPIRLPDGAPAGYWADYNNAPAGASEAPGPHDVDFAPGFADADARDFRLLPTSRCLGRGFLGRPIGAGRRLPVSGQGLSFQNVRVVGVAAHSADLSWSVGGGKATCIVAYGTAPDRLTHVIVRDKGPWYGRHHLTTLTDLLPGTRYYFRVGSRRLLDGPTPFHSFRYAWPERTPAGEAEYYATLRKEDTMDPRLHSFTTRTADVRAPRVLHVSPAGRDEASGVEGDPLPTLRRACEMAEPGDRVVVHTGTYRETLRPLRSGLPGQPIVFEAARGERVEINGSQERIPFGANLLDRHHIVVRGFIFFGQAEKAENLGGFGQILAAGASNLRIEQCVFDGRMNYCNSISIAWSRDVTLHNNLFISHHGSLSANDCEGTITVTRNSFLGPTLSKLYTARCDRLVLRNNLFGEHLFPKKKLQYKLKLPLVREVDADYNCYYFDPANDERRILDWLPAGEDPAGTTAQPEDDANRKRFHVKGTLEAWQRTHGQDRHSFIGDPRWANSNEVAEVRSRAMGWPNRFFPFEPVQRADLGLDPDSPCRGAGENGVDIGADASY